MPSAVPLWHHDASYRYYLHGPLQRTEIGDLKVQGLDYAYTLQGWLKGVNGGQLNPQFDMGHDGEGTYAQGDFARDAFGFTLSYFEGDYTAIGTSAVNFEIAMGGSLETWRHDLWNGNIGSMTTALPTASNQTQGMGYLYDQLNRLKEAKAAINFASNTWGTETITDRYENIFTYDANGNILTQHRADEAGTAFDQLTYNYEFQDMNAGNILLQRNRLYHVNDASSNTGNGQIEDQGLFEDDPALINTDNNYIYDELGQLITDDQEEIEEIIWRVDGKISRVVRETISTRKSLEFVYDAMGNRVAKKVFSDNSFQTTSLEQTTYYLRDATGDIVSIYNESLGELDLVEQHIYGSSNIGMRVLRLDMLTTSDPLNTGLKEPIRGERRFELTNHLDNILAVTSDQLCAVEGSGIINYYNPEVVNYRDYYAFGSEIKSRASEDEYNHGYNGNENTSEICDCVDIYSSNYREYDSRAGRWWSRDPKTQYMPWESPYSFANNMAVVGSDPNGDWCVPCIIILLGYLTAPSVAVAPTGDPSDGEAILQAKNNQATWIMASTLAGAVAARPKAAAIMTGEEIVEEFAGVPLPSAGDLIPKKILLPKKTYFFQSKRIYGETIDITPGKTTTIIGSNNGTGLGEVRNLGLHRQGENVGGYNMLTQKPPSEIDGKQFDFANAEHREWYWINVNKKWLDDAIVRNDVIRVVDAPTVKNKFKDGIDSPENLNFFGREVEYLESLGYSIGTNGVAIKN